MERLQISLIVLLYIIVGAVAGRLTGGISHFTYRVTDSLNRMLVGPPQLQAPFPCDSELIKIINESTTIRLRTVVRRSSLALPAFMLAGITVLAGARYLPPLSLRGAMIAGAAMGFCQSWVWVATTPIVWLAGGKYGGVVLCSALVLWPAGVIAALLARAISLRRSRGRTAFECTKCGYCLFMNVSGACPECGSQNAVAREPATRG